MAQCTAKSKQTKKRCRRPAIRGGFVCRFHGGSAGQVRRKAAERLAALADPAVDALGQLVKLKREPAVRLATAKTILDRTGHGAPKKFEISGGESTMETFEELNSAVLTKDEKEKLTTLSARFEAGDILDADEQRHLHELRQKSGLGRRWLRFVTTRPDGSVVRLSLPDNKRDEIEV